MTMRKLALLLLFTCAALAGGLWIWRERQGTAVSYRSGGEIWFKHSGIQIKFDPLMRAQAFFRGKSTLPTVSHFLIVEGQRVTDFRVDYASIRSERFHTQFGTAERLVFRGVADGPRGSQIEKRLTIDWYKSDPNSTVTSATYTILRADAALRLDTAVSNFLLLDASTFGGAGVPYGFSSFQGGSFEWGKDVVLPLTPGFTQENFEGMVTRKAGKEVEALGGGIPLVDLWTRQAGLAVAHLSPKQVQTSLPVRVEKDGRVSVAIVEEPERMLGTGERFTTIDTLLTAHTGDFYEPLRAYAGMMKRQGLLPANPTQEAYQASWCGWGYEFNFKPAEMLGVRPKLQEMGIRWVTIDDRWFSNYGDWEPRSDTFPGGVSGLKKMVDEFHRSGNKVQLWWYPLAVEASPGETESHVFAGSRIAKEHPEWLIQDRSGAPAVWNRNLNVLCPAVPGVQDYIRRQTRKFVEDWGIDGHKLDVVYTTPMCYNKAHGHATPEESVQQLPTILKIIYETTVAAKPNGVVQICPCGTTPNVYWLPYMNQAVTADPIGAAQVRNRIKMYKALLGPQAAVYADHVELTDMQVLGESNYLEKGHDFASAVGTGGVVGTKFVWPEPRESGLAEKELKPRRQNALTPEKEQHWRKWMAIYNRLMLSQGEYLNLYDITHDIPETHVIRKSGSMFYAFYASRGEPWAGPIELRGLNPGRHQIYDYENDRELGAVEGNNARINVGFADHLLIEVRPVVPAR